jgi:hypothetical protein
MAPNKGDRGGTVVNTDLDGPWNGWAWVGPGPFEAHMEINTPSVRL